MKDLLNIKIEDKDSLGRKITNIFIRSTYYPITEEDETSERVKAVKYMIYETEDGQLRYKAPSECVKKLMPYMESIQSITTLLGVESSLRKRYYKIVANSLYNIFEEENEGAFTTFFEELRKKIEKNLYAIARLKYLKKYMLLMLYTGIIIAICLLFSWIYPFREIPYVNYYYLASCGILGGFFSVVSRINRQPIDPFLPFERSRLDVYVRYVVAALSGVLIYWFLKSGFVTFIDAPKLGFQKNIFLTLSIAVVAGFSERIVPAIITAKEKAYYTTINKKTN